MNARAVPFIDHGTTQQSADEKSGPMLIVAADSATRAQLVGLYPDVPPDPGRVYLGVFAGAQRTGGYAVRVDGVERQGDRLNIRSTFSAPAANALTIQVITSPAQLVSIASSDAVGLREAVLIDQSGTEKARVAVPQSGP